jgi:hypothetical protein
MWFRLGFLLIKLGESDVYDLRVVASKVNRVYYVL